MQSYQVTPFLFSMLEDLNCNTISVTETEGDRVFCGFKNKCPMVIEDLRLLAKPIELYRTEEHNYIAVYSRQTLAAFLEEKFRKLVRNILPIDCVGYFDEKLGFVFDNEAAFRRFIRRQNVVDAAREAGIDYGSHVRREYDEDLLSLLFTHPTHFAFFPPVSAQPPQIDYWLNFCSDREKIYKAIFPDNEKRKALRNQRQAFLQGENSRESSVHRLTNHFDQHRDVIKNIFSFLSTPTLKTEEKFSSVIQCVSENTELEVNTFLKKIKTLTAKLEKESKETSGSIKTDKIKFLQLLLSLKTANPRFSLRECLKIIATSYPALYENALLGTLSRTKKLIKEINEDKSNKKSRARIAL